MGGRAGRRENFVVSSLAALTAATVLLAGAAPPAAAQSETCPNASIRAQQHSAFLPDCRAYEQASPVEKNGADIAPINDYIKGVNGLTQAAAQGGSVTYVSTTSFDDPEGAVGGAQQYFARRSPGGWSSQNIMPPGTSLAYGNNGAEGAYYAFNPDLSSALLDGGSDGALPDSGAPPGFFQNLYLRDNATGDFRALNTAMPTQPASSFDFTFEGTTATLDHILLFTEAQLTPDAPAGNEIKVYLWTGGQYSWINEQPDGTRGSFRDPGSLNSWAHAISDDGSRVYWRSTGAGTSSKIFLRDTQAEATTLIAAGVNGVSAAPEFWAASADGSTAFITDDAGAALTADTIPGSGQNLYRYDAADDQLTNLTPTADAEVMGVVGASEGADYVYFVANGVLASGASPGDCQLSDINPPTSGRCNLYLRHDGTTTFIARLADGRRYHTEEGDRSNWMRQVQTGDSPGHSARVTPDGSHLVFMSVRSLTGFDNTDPVTGAAQSEVYLYDAEAGDGGDLGCVSCSPSGARPSGRSSIPLGTAFPQTAIDQIRSTYQSRVLRDDGGRVFFDSGAAVVSRDTNARQDVYQWEAPGVGGCEQASGCISLISDGQSGADASILDASESGEDVFFRTRSQLVGQDTDTNYDLYTARVDGGFAAQSPPPPPPPCQGDSCQGPSPSPPPASPPASSAFHGAPSIAGDDEANDCQKLERKAKKADKRERKAKKQAKKLKRKANKASGKKAKKLEKKAKRAKRKAHKRHKQSKKADKKAKQCRRGAK